MSFPVAHQLPANPDLDPLDFHNGQGEETLLKERGELRVLVVILFLAVALERSLLIE